MVVERERVGGVLVLETHKDAVPRRGGEGARRVSRARTGAGTRGGAIISRAGAGAGTRGGPIIALARARARAFALALALAPDDAHLHDLREQGGGELAKVAD